jgi:carbon storage regulator CsrA
MLVLTRKQAEQIQLGENVVITILRVKGQSVRIGIDAPREVRVIRAELPKSSDQTSQSPSAGLAAESTGDMVDSRLQSASSLRPARSASTRDDRDARPAASAETSPLARIISRRTAPINRTSPCRANPNLLSKTSSRSSTPTMTR